ncbi:MAG: hypothetical protein KAJ55_03515 [Anaerolineales bacterium]|nr:hypothetical protein [Anaerolineales bacterium]
MTNMLHENSGGIKSIISGVGAGVEGAYVQFFSSTVRDNKWLWLGIAGVQGGFNRTVEFDIATGPGGGEVDDYSDCYFFHTGRQSQNTMNFYWPINIPAGSRVAIRCKDNDAAAIAYVIPNVTLTDISMPFGDPVSRLVLPAVNVISGASAGVDGAIVPIIGALPVKLDYLMIHWIQVSGVNNAIGNWDLMTGAAGLEFDRLGEMACSRNQSPIRKESSVPWCGPVSLDVGERLSIRAKTDVNVALTMLWGAVGLEYPPQ